MRILSKEEAIVYMAGSLGAIILWSPRRDATGLYYRIRDNVFQKSSGICGRWVIGVPEWLTLSSPTLMEYGATPPATPVIIKDGDLSIDVDGKTFAHRVKDGDTLILAPGRTKEIYRLITPRHSSRLEQLDEFRGLSIRVYKQIYRA